MNKIIRMAKKPIRNTLNTANFRERRHSTILMAREKAYALEAKKALNSYRFTSNKEPSEQQLDALMQKVAESAQERAAIANAKFQESILQEVERVKSKWLP